MVGARGSFVLGKQAPAQSKNHSLTHTQESEYQRQKESRDAEPEPRLGSSPPHGHALPCPALILERFKPPCASEGGFPGALAKLKIILKLAFVSDRLFLCPPPFHTPFAHISRTPSCHGNMESSPSSGNSLSAPRVPQIPLSMPCRLFDAAAVRSSPKDAHHRWR